MTGKGPKDAPSRGDFAFRRGDPERRGLVVTMCDEDKWCVVRWGDGGGPRLCHAFELVKVEA